MNKMKTEKRRAIIAALMEGMSVRAVSRMTGACKQAILKLQADLGCAWAAYHNEHVRGLKPASIQCDEVWAFNYCKDKNVAKTRLRDISYGSTWTWTAIDPETKLIITYHLGLRSPNDAKAFMLDLAGRVNNHTQITTDGLGSYPEAVREAFGNMVDFAQLIKVYREDRQGEARYSPATCIGCQHKHVVGFPEPDRISTSIVERHNLTIRMSMRRFTRLTNGHSKKIENHGHALAVFFFYYNFCRRHESLKGQTPAMSAGLADHVWSLEEMIGLI